MCCSFAFDLRSLRLADLGMSYNVLNSMPLEMGGMLKASFGIAHLSWRYDERPKGKALSG
eukprot:329498-Amphidinium_carterae.1